VCDIGERSAVDECRRMLKCLNKIWLERILQQCCSGSLTLDVSNCYRIIIVSISYYNLGDPLLHVVYILSQAEDSHDLTCYCYLESVFSRAAARLSAKSVNDVTQLSVVHVDSSLPCDLSRIYVHLIALLDMVVHHGCDQVVCRSYGVHVASEVKVDILHRNYLGISAACSSALDTEYRSQGWLTKCHYGLLAKSVHCICKSY